MWKGDKSWWDFCAFQYVLETYTEGRKTGRTYDPYGGGFVDGPENGTPPQPWDMACQPNQLFVDEVKEIEVPHTAYVKVETLCGFISCHLLVLFAYKSLASGHKQKLG